MFPYYAFSSAPFTTFDASYRNQDYAHPASSAIRRAAPAAAAAASATHAPLAAPVAPPAPLLQPASGPHTPAAVFPPPLWGAPVLTASPLEITFPSVPAYSMYEYMGLTTRPAAPAAAAPPPQLQQPAVCNAVGWPIFVAPAPPRGTQPVLMPWTDDMYNEVMSLYNMLSANQQASFEAIVGQARTVGEIADKMFTGFPFSQLQPSPLVMPSAHDCFMPEPLPPPMLGSQLLQSSTADQLAQQAAQAARSQEMQLSPTWLFNMDEEEAANEEGEDRGEEKTPTKWQARCQQSTAYLECSLASDQESELEAIISSQGSQEDEKPTDESLFCFPVRQLFDRYANTEAENGARIMAVATAAVGPLPPPPAAASHEARVGGGQKRRNRGRRGSGGGSSPTARPPAHAQPSASEARAFRAFQERSGGAYEMSASAIDELVVRSIERDLEISRTQRRGTSNTAAAAAQRQ